jgi:uncharacterized protein
MAQENSDKMIAEIKQLNMPDHIDIKPKDVDIKRLGSILWLAQETETQNFEDLLLLKGLGPRTLQSLTLVSEIIHGTPSRFTDPARFAFAHGGKGGRPFPVPTNVYDKTIDTLKNAVEKAKIGDKDKQTAIKKLTNLAQQAEADFIPNQNLETLLQREKDDAWKYGGRTIRGFSKPLGE